MKVYAMTVRNRAAGLILALAVVAAGAALLLVGLALLTGLALVGGLLGTGVVLYRRLRGRGPPSDLDRYRADAALDPSLEVFPEETERLTDGHRDERFGTRG